MKLLAVDPSLTCSGWALFNTINKELLAVGQLKSLPSTYSLEDRLKDLQDKFSKIFKKISLQEFDILITEAPTTTIDPNALIKVEQVRSLIESIARSLNVKVAGRINPRTVQYEVLGLKGKQLDRDNVKLIARNLVYKLYKTPLENLKLISCEEDLKKHQDIVDAILIGHLCLSKLDSANMIKTSLEAYLASTQIKSKNRRFKESDFR